MSDIVERLRQLSADAAKVECGEPWWWVEVSSQAADEIERLRAGRVHFENGHQVHLLFDTREEREAFVAAHSTPGAKR